MLGPDPATLRAVEAHARATCFGESGDSCDACLTADRCTFWRTYWRGSVEALAAYHRSLGEEVRAARVERCANMDGKEAGDE